LQKAKKGCGELPIKKGMSGEERRGDDEVGNQKKKRFVLKEWRREKDWLKKGIYPKPRKKNGRQRRGGRNYVSAPKRFFLLTCKGEEKINTTTRGGGGRGGKKVVFRGKRGEKGNNRRDFMGKKIHKISRCLHPFDSCARGEENFWGKKERDSPSFLRRSWESSPLSLYEKKKKKVILISQKKGDIPPEITFGKETTSRGGKTHSPP